MLLGTHVSDGKLLLQLDRFDIFNLWEVVNEYVNEIKYYGHNLPQEKKSNA
jgi:hypothetical protein